MKRKFNPPSFVGEGLARFHKRREPHLSGLQSSSQNVQDPVDQVSKDGARVVAERDKENVQPSCQDHESPRKQLNPPKPRPLLRGMPAAQASSTDTGKDLKHRLTATKEDSTIPGKTFHSVMYIKRENFVKLQHVHFSHVRSTAGEL
eukprot:1158772-Pelagomonas_calceolata.AAC.8